MRRMLALVVAAVLIAAGLAAQSAAAADLDNPSTKYQTVADCGDGVGAVAVGPTAPPLFVNHMGFGVQIGTSANPCDTAHKILVAKATLFYMSSDDPSIPGVAVAQLLEECNDCSRLVALGTH